MAAAIKWGKGARGPCEVAASIDPTTEARVYRVTSDASISHPPYFLQCAFTSDQRHLIFTSYRAGAAQLFEAGFPDGEIRQLTDGEPIHPYSAVIAPDDSVLFVRVGSVWRVDRDNLEETLIGDSGGQLGECSLNAAGDWYVAACKRENTWGLTVGTVDGREAGFIDFPRTVIHPQFNPVDPDWIEFAGDPAPRMHRVRRDGTGLECLHAHGNDEFIVHETFLGASQDLAFCVWPFALRRLDWRTREVSTISDFNAWHIAPNRDGTKILCDTVHPDIGLQLVDVASGERRTVCLSEASSGGSQWKLSRYAVAEDWERARQARDKSRSLSWMEMAADTVYGPQWTHPHPSFSHDERMAVFASDKSGFTQVYVAELPAH